MSATSADIKKTCHELLDRLLDAKAAFHADCIKLGKYDHDSANLNMVIDIDAALDAAKAAYAASVNGGDVRKTLESHHDKYQAGTGTRGIPGAMREINALITRICGRDAGSLEFRQELAKKEGVHVWLTAEEQSRITGHKPTHVHP
jgi:hypothetical protein